MARDEGMGPGAVLLAFLVGAVAGAAVALLYAPATGEETREYLGQRAREGRDKVADAARQGRDVLNRQRDNLVDAFDPTRQPFRPAGEGERES